LITVPLPIATLFCACFYMWFGGGVFFIIIVLGGKGYGSDVVCCGSAGMCWLLRLLLGLGFARGFKRAKSGLP